jgi:hypothetical protein
VNASAERDYTDREWAAAVAVEWQRETPCQHLFELKFHRVLGSRLNHWKIGRETLDKRQLGALEQKSLDMAARS